MEVKLEWIKIAFHGHQALIVELHWMVKLLTFWYREEKPTNLYLMRSFIKHNASQECHRMIRQTWLSYFKILWKFRLVCVAMELMIVELWNKLMLVLVFQRLKHLLLLLLRVKLKIFHALQRCLEREDARLQLLSKHSNLLNYIHWSSFCR